MSHCRMLAVALMLLGLAAGISAADLPPGVACLLEDNGAELLPQLTNPNGDSGDGEVETKVQALVLALNL